MKISFNLLVTFVVLLGCFGNISAREYNWDKLSKSERKWNKRQPYKRVLNYIPIKKDMIIGEIGSGYGRYTMHLSKFVGVKGKIFANDVTQKAIDVLGKRIKFKKIKNVIPVMGKFADPMFPSNKLDCIFMINTYHHIDNVVNFLKNAAKYLSSNGVFAIVEHTPDKFPKDHSTPRTTIINHFLKIGFQLSKEDTSLKYDSIYIFSKKK